MAQEKGDPPRKVILLSDILSLINYISLKFL